MRVLIRSCWDYHLHIAQFRHWLARLENLGARVWNDPTIVRWNADKRYLIDLAARGVATIPTTAVAAGNVGEVEEIVDIKWMGSLRRQAGHLGQRLRDASVQRAAR